MSSLTCWTALHTPSTPPSSSGQSRCYHRCVTLTPRALAVYSEVAKGTAQSSSSQIKTAAFVPLRDAHADAWRRTREGNNRMPKLFATIAGTIVRQRYVRLGVALTRHATIDWCSAQPHARFLRRLGSCRNHAVYRERRGGRSAGQESDPSVGTSSTLRVLSVQRNRWRDCGSGDN